MVHPLIDDPFLARDLAVSAPQETPLYGEYDNRDDHHSAAGGDGHGHEKGCRLNLQRAGCPFSLLRRVLIRLLRRVWGYRPNRTSEPGRFKPAILRNFKPALTPKAKPGDASRRLPA